MSSRPGFCPALPDIELRLIGNGGEIVLFEKLVETGAGKARYLTGIFDIFPGLGKQVPEVLLLHPGQGLFTESLPGGQR